MSLPQVTSVGYQACPGIRLLASYKPGLPNIRFVKHEASKWVSCQGVACVHICESSLTDDAYMHHGRRPLK